MLGLESVVLSKVNNMCWWAMNRKCAASDGTMVGVSPILGSFQLEAGMWRSYKQKKFRASAHMTAVDITHRTGKMLSRTFWDSLRCH